jgi:hypothetical protein
MAVSITSILTIAIGVVVILGILLFVYILILKKRISSFMSGKDASSLEESVLNLIKRADDAEKVLSSHANAINIIDKRVKKSVRGYSLVKYDAYQSGAGEQSFASGLIDENQDGYILSVISNRNHVGVYAKNIKAGKSETALTEEEILALEEAKKSL